MGDWDFRTQQTARQLSELIEDAVLDVLEELGVPLREREHHAEQVAVHVLHQLDRAD